MQAVAQVSPANAQHKASRAIGCHVISLFWPDQSWSDLADDFLAIPRSNISACRQTEWDVDGLISCWGFTEVPQYFNIVKSFLIFFFFLFGRQYTTVRGTKALLSIDDEYMSCVFDPPKPIEKKLQIIQIWQQDHRSHTLTVSEDKHVFKLTLKVNTRLSVLLHSLPGLLEHRTNKSILLFK